MLIHLVLSNREPAYPSVPAPGITTQQHHHSYSGIDLGTVESASSENLYWRSTTLATNNPVIRTSLGVADRCYTNIRIPVQRAPTLSDYTADGAIAYFDQDIATTEGTFTCQHDLFPNNSDKVQRAPTLSNYTADGVIAYDTFGQDIGTTEGAFACQRDLFPNNSDTVQRAPTLSNYTADGAIAYDTFGQDVTSTEGIFSCQTALFPSNSTTV